MAVFLTTTYLHITSITNMSWVYLRIAFQSKRLHAAPYFCQDIWQCFSLQLTFTSPPSHVCLELTFALLYTAYAFTLHLISVKRYGSVSLYNLLSHHLLHTFVLSFTSHFTSQLAPSRSALTSSRDMAAFCFSTNLRITTTSLP